MKRRRASGEAAEISRWVRSLAMGRVEDSWRSWDAKHFESASRFSDGHALTARCGAMLSDGGWAHEKVFVPWVVAWRRWMGQEVLLTEALGDLAERCRRAGIPVLAIKGSDLATRIYGPGERPRTDIDLVVLPEDFPEVDRLLKVAGYSPAHPDPALAHAHWFASTYRSREHPGVVIDLHWDLGRPGRTLWQMKAVFERAETFPGRSGLLRLTRDDLLVHLALHAVAFHGGSGRWIWWLDQALLHRHVDEGGGGAWETSYERAREVGGVVALDAARLRAMELFGEVGRSPHEACLRARCANEIGSRLEGGRGGTIGRWVVAALAVDRWRNFGRIALDVGRRGRFRLASAYRRRGGTSVGP